MVKRAPRKIAHPRVRESVEHPVPGVRYRSPLYLQGHIFLTIEDDIAACGRLLLIDELWWQEAGWEERIGVEAYLVVDDRKGDKCGACTKLWQAHTDRQRASNKADIFTRQERPEAIAARDVKIKTMEAWAAHFELLWGEPVELILEG